MKPLRLGVLLPTRGILLRGEGPPDPSPVLRMAERAEAAGLDSVWVGDSLTAKPRLEPLATLAAVAMRTSRVTLGTAVLLAPLRNPVQLCQMAATVDILSGGRLVLGMGVGGAFDEAQRAEWQMVGVDPHVRGARMTELVEVCRRLWAEDEVTFHGRHFTLEAARSEPKPLQPGGVPMLLATHFGTGSEAQYRRTGRHADGAMGISDGPEAFASMLDRVRFHAGEAGRDAEALRTAFYMTVNIGHDVERAGREADRFIRAYYGVNVWADKWGPFGTPETVAERMVEYARAGAQEIIVRFAAPDPASQLDAFVKDVVPAVRGALAGGG